MAQVRLNADARRFRNFCREYLVFVEGSVAGQPVEFEAWLLGITNELLSRGPDGRRRYTSAYIGLAKKNNKSTFGAALALYFLVVESARSRDGGMQVYAIAASKDQAKIVFGHAKAMVEASPLLSDYLTVHRDTISNPHTGARFEVLSADAPKTHGKNPSVVICDELHAHETGELYDAMYTAMIARDEPLFVTLTNAGSNDKGSSKCAEVYRRGRDGSDPGMYFYSPTVSDDELDDMAAWKRVNPSSWITIEKLLAFQKAMPPYRFERFHLNRWTRADKAWLPRGAWDALDVGRPEPKERVVLGLDMSRSRDTTALAIAAPRGGGKIAAHGEVWAAWHDDQDEPPDAHHVVKGDLIPFELVFERVREVCRQYDVQEIAYDPYRIPDETAERLEAEGLPMTKFPQTHTLMVPASQGLFELVTSRRLLREPDEVLDAHIASAAAKDVPGPRNSWRLDKDSARSPSDYAFALAMAVRRAGLYEPPTDDEFAVRFG
jgi:phage terminase large subunit-like protein